MRSPAPPPHIAASLILPAILWGPNYVPVRLFSFFPFFIQSFDLFFVILFLFLSPFLISSYSSILILVFLSVHILLILLVVFFVFLFFFSYMLICLLYQTHKLCTRTSATIHPYFCVLSFFIVFELLIFLFSSYSSLYRKSRENSSLAKNPPKSTTANIVQQSNCRWHCEPTCFSIQA